MDFSLFILITFYHANSFCLLPIFIKFPVPKWRRAWNCIFGNEVMTIIRVNFADVDDATICTGSTCTIKQMFDC